MLEISDKDPRKLIYKGNDVGKFEVKDGSCHLRLDIEFAITNPGDDAVVLSHLGSALRKVHPAPPKPDFVFTSADGEVKPVDGFQTLNEKQIKAGGEKWDFHKNDADHWPSKLHGHAGNKKLDAITGKIYDINTRNIVGTLDKKPLKLLQSQLRGHKDFPHACGLLPKISRASKIIEALEEKDN